MVTTNINKTSQFLVVSRLFSKYYWKSFFGPFFNFLFPLLIYGILGGLMGWKEMLAGTMAMISVSIGLLILPFEVVSLKKSVLLKRIGASPVQPWMFTFVICFFFLVILILSSSWLSLCALLITLDPSIFDGLTSVTGLFGFSQGLIINIILAISLGFVIAAFSKTEIQTQAIGLTLFLPIAFLSGQFLSTEKIASSETLEMVSRLIPFRYSTMMMTEAWIGDVNIPNVLTSNANIWQVHDYTVLSSSINFSYEELNQLSQPGANISAILQAKIADAKIILYDKTDHIVSFIYPYLMIIIFLIIGIKSFKWTTKT